MVGKGAVSILQGKGARARWAAEQGKGARARWVAEQSPQSSRAEPPEADAKGDQCGMEQHWCVEISCLSSGLEPASLIP